jgi:hypothetical protein
MASQTDICNLALIRLGSLPILSIDDTDKRAVAVRGVWGQVVDIVLRDHPWNFAVRRAKLARLSAAPLFGYAYAYQLPAEQLRVLGLLNVDTGLMDPTLGFEIEGQTLVTDQASASIKYVERVTATGRFDPRFCSALASRLAAEVALHLTGSPAVKKQMMDEYVYELSTARSIDAQENPPEVYREDSWMDARL